MTGIYKLGLLILGYKTAVKFAYAQDIRNLVKSVKQQYPFLKHIPENLVVAISKVESNHKPNVTGKSGEYGLMQIMPTTFDWIFSEYGLGRPVDPYDPFVNVLGGMLVLDRFHDNLGNWFDTIHAYNVGVSGFLFGTRNWSYFNKVLMWWIFS